ncbi:uncharacterized protein LOC100903018 [Galendromus occidentalis]|uniref:Uncharacterized protein LOC100903018 n=1 Tax=Galendromus occidentalis TaxID=34638 RepID=A0AAJ6QPJ3_9ACAR|nr:uncharacterized protein LOC100903018 [Galendromus occidentalis]
MIPGSILVLCFTVVVVHSYELAPLNDAIKVCSKDKGVSDKAADKLIEIVAKYVNEFKEGDDLKALQENVKKDSEVALKEDGQEGKFSDMGTCISEKLAPKAQP